MDKTSYIRTNKSLYIENLSARLDANERFAERDFASWVFSHLHFPSGCELLDVACGTGREVVTLLTREPQIGKVVAIDFAETAIEALRHEAAERQLDNVEALVLDMERAPEVLSPRKFRHIFSLYGIHYSPRMVELLSGYAALLEPGGSIFVCGPDAFSNVDVLRLLVGPDSPASPPAFDRGLRPFVEREDLSELRRRFATVAVTRFENVVSFPDVAAFIQWWRNHDLYSDAVEQFVRDQVSVVINETGAFTVNKNVLGLLLS